MGLRKVLMLLTAVLLGMAASAAFADRGHHRGHHHHHGARLGIFFGAPFFYPWGYSAPYYYNPPVVVVPAAPPVYIEQADELTAAGQGQEAGYWYYCAESRAYYPYVRQCPGAWQRVAPRPAP